MKRSWWMCLVMLSLCLPWTSVALTVGGSGGGGLSVQDEAVGQGGAQVVNCQGDGIACTVAGGVLSISVSGVGGAGLEDPGGNGLVNRTGLGVSSPYAGTSCTNQVLRVLSAAGAGTCVTLTSAYVDSSIALTGGHLGQFAATTSAQLATVLSDETGASGGFVRAGATLAVFAATTSAELASVLSDESGSSGGFLRAGGNAATATALAANGANCPAGQAPLGVDASGAVEGCFSVLGSLTFSTGLAESGGTVTVALTESGSLFDGTGASLSCGGGTGGQMQIGPSSNLEYCGYEATPLLHIAGLPAGLTWGDTSTCSGDENMGKLTVVAGVIQCSPDVADASTAAWNDGGTTSLTCGGGAQGQHQVMNTGRLEYCGGEDVSALYAGFLLPSPLTFNIMAATCTGDANGGKLTVNGSNQVVCASDNVGEGGGGPGDLTAFGTCSTGDCATTGTPLSQFTMDEGVAPSSPAAGAGTVYMDETSKNLCVKSSDGAVKCGVQVADPVTHMVVTGIAADGSVSQAQLSSANLSDSATLVKLSDAQIVSSKQLVPRVCTLSAASGTVTAPNADLCDVFERHDVSGTLDIPTPTATGLNPRSQQVLTFSLYAATAQSVTWSSAYAQGYGVALPTTIPATTYVAVSMRYNTTSAKYETWASTVDTVTTVAKGGTGVATLTGLAVGNGTSPFTGVTTSAGLAAVLSDEEGSTGGFVRAGGNVATATALAANPTPCTAGQFVTDIAADGTLTCGTPTGTGTMHLFVGAVKFPTSNAAILDSGGNYYKLGYDETTSWCAWWQIEVPKDYTGSPVFEGTVTPTGNSSGSLILDVSVMAVTPGDAAVLDTDSYDTTNTCTLASIPTTGGHPARISCALTSNDSMAAEDALRVKVCRNVSDTAATRMNLSYAVIQYAR